MERLRALELAAWVGSCLLVGLCGPGQVVGLVEPQLPHLWTGDDCARSVGRPRGTFVPRGPWGCSGQQVLGDLRLGWALGRGGPNKVSWRTASPAPTPPRASPGAQQ